MKNELRQMVGSGEKVLYEGKPNKRCFLFESVFNPLLPFALVWAFIDFGIIGTVFLTGEMSEMGFFLIPFFALHLMPVWIYLAGVLFSFRKYRNTEYIVTDHAIYVSSGIFSKHFNVKPFAELSQVNLHRGMFDQMMNVGDIVVTSNQILSNDTVGVVTIGSIENYLEVYNIVKKLQTDIYTDIMYPNDLRPEENHGYNTKYKG